MTFEKILNDINTRAISTKEAYDAINIPDKLKKINYYAHIQDIRKEPLSDAQLQELDAIVNILQILYTDPVGSPVSDSVYDTLEEMLVNMGIPRLTGSVEINDSKKIGHTYEQLRGTLDKVYYLTKDEERLNNSREYLDEWIKRSEDKIERVTHRRIDLNKVKIVCNRCGSFYYIIILILCRG